ncbi:hypothetical protein SCP_0102210 [Sparassis crispa]|uniref:Uncharacterized protein n=1 Tax=Sparassis crispa TaxID=139825 RepID=A0A401G5A8_9APHY|nr:hypothetical protein SCP_0102210 [Sparassis crispa]GBE77348.1 hypothetical protein SCP_0102210 [Sparassis crispa]
MEDAQQFRAPAMKVGGRRMSVTTRPKHPPHAEPKPPSPTNEPVDYPRPAPPGEQAPEHAPHEEEHMKKEKKKGSTEHDKRFQENLYQRAEHNRPSKDVHGAKNINAIGAGGRIGQPAGRSLLA